MEYDLHSQVKAEVALDQQTINSATTTDGNVIDTKGFESLEYIIFSGAVTAAGTLVTTLLEESDEVTFGGEETAVASTEILGTALALDADADDDKVFRIGSIGKKRYQRLALVSTGAPNLVIGAVGVLSNPHETPVAEQYT
jgi:hypothetical protein